MNTCWVRYTKALDMEKALTPNRLDVDPSNPNTAREFNHWLKTFTYFLKVLPKEGLDELSVLTNFVSPHVYDHIIDCDTYEEAIQVLKTVFGNTHNDVYARNLLLSRKQNTGESVEEYLKALKVLAKDCNFKPVDAAAYCNEVVRDVFIAGLRSTYAQQKLLANKTLDTGTALEQAKLYDPGEEKKVFESFSVEPPPDEDDKETSHTNTDVTPTSPSPRHTLSSPRQLSPRQLSPRQLSLRQTSPRLPSYTTNTDTSNYNTKTLRSSSPSSSTTSTSSSTSSSSSNPPSASVSSSGGKNRRKNGSIRKHIFTTIDTNNIIHAAMSTRRRNGLIRDTRLRTDPKNVMCPNLEPSLSSKPILRRHTLNSNNNNNSNSNSNNKQQRKQDWRLVMKQNAIDLKRRSHRMKKAPERLDW